MKRLEEQEAAIKERVAAIQREREKENATIEELQAELSALELEAKELPNAIAKVQQRATELEREYLRKKAGTKDRPDGAAQ